MLLLIVLHLSFLCKIRCMNFACSSIFNSYVTYLIFIIFFCYVFHNSFLSSAVVVSVTNSQLQDSCRLRKVPDILWTAWTKPGLGTTPIQAFTETLTPKSASPADPSSPWAASEHAESRFIKVWPSGR